MCSLSLEYEYCTDCESGYFLSSSSNSIDYFKCLPCNNELETTFPRKTDGKLICTYCGTGYPNCDLCSNSNCIKCIDKYFLADPLILYSKTQCSLCTDDSGYKVTSTIDGTTRCQLCSFIDKNCLTCVKDSCKKCKDTYYLIDNDDNSLYEACVLCDQPQQIKSIFIYMKV